MAIKFLIKGCFSAVVAIVIGLYPEKAAALLVLFGQTIWNIGVMVGDHLHIPGEGKAKAATALIGFAWVNPKAFLAMASISPNSDHKEKP